MDIYQHRPHASARRFESGTPNTLGLFAAEAGLELLLKVGLQAIAEQIGEITSLIKQAVDAHGWNLVTPRNRHGAMLAVESTDAEKLVERLYQRGIILTQRDGNIRIAPHFYNNAADVDRLVAGLEAEAGLLG
jgi:selenocysteine lyase/cysteine desulfurase